MLCLVVDQATGSLVAVNPQPGTAAECTGSIALSPLEYGLVAQPADPAEFAGLYMWGLGAVLGAYWVGYAVGRVFDAIREGRR